MEKCALQTTDFPVSQSLQFYYIDLISKKTGGRYLLSSEPMAKKKTSQSTSKSSPGPVITVAILEEGQKPRRFQFQKNFIIGRDIGCEVQVARDGVSRKHAQVFLKKGKWYIKDLGSANGTFVNKKRIQEVPLAEFTEVELGLGEALLHFSTGDPTSRSDQTVRKKAPSLTHYVKHYFGGAREEGIGQHTRMIREAYHVVQKKQKLTFALIIAIVLAITGGITVYSIIQHRQAEQQKKLAQELFYSMKSLELQLAQLREVAQRQNDQETLQKISRFQQQEQELARNYDRFLDELHFYDDSRWSERDRIILHVARLFGECELAVPDEFIAEVNRYIKKWRSTDRLQKAVRRALENKYPEIVTRTFLKYGLPPQYFYLALQESDFDLKTIGPRTRFGIAKGIWQFIPPTASRYGLRTGPLVGLRRYDARDERFNFPKATEAAAQYILDIYTTEAQASGLLVIASYNWGERKIRELVRQLPLNPQERNFWQLMKRYRNEIPRQTYDYVFYIFSAAVIGENPRLFGFDFKNPLRLETATEGE